MATRAVSQHYVANPAELPKGTLVDLFFRAVDERGEREALRYKRAGEWRSISHDEYARRVHQVARGLEALGVARGDRVGILSENRPEWAIADMAILCLGALDVPLYPTLPAQQITPLLEDSGMTVAFVSTAEQLQKLREARRGVQGLRKIVVFDGATVEDHDIMSWDQLLELGKRDGGGDFGEFRRRAREASPDDVATIIYTSGTTGRPKGVMLTHGNIHSNVQACGSILPTTESDAALSFLPLSHIFERMLDYWYLSHGCVIAYVPAFDEVAGAMREVRPTIVASVPRLYEKIYARVVAASGLRRRLVAWARGVALAQAERVFEGRRVGRLFDAQRVLADRLVFRKLRARTGGRIRYFISGGAPLELEVAKFFYGAGLTILEGYGLTETSPVTNVNTPEAIRLGTVGKPVPGTEIMIAEDGEILVRGPQVMKGYYEQPEATSAVIDADGWFHTGDIGAIDADGFLRITDRKKDLIVTAGGKNIAPQPIENRVKTNRFVEEAVMVGDRRPYAVLLIVPAYDALAAWARETGVGAASPVALLAEPRVREKMREEVFAMIGEFARYEQPKKIALLTEPFTVEGGELTPSMKVRRRVVQERYANVIESLYANDAEVQTSTDLA